MLHVRCWGGRLEHQPLVRFPFRKRHSNDDTRVLRSFAMTFQKDCSSTSALYSFPKRVILTTLTPCNTSVIRSRFESRRCAHHGGSVKFSRIHRCDSCELVSDPLVCHDDSHSYEILWKRRSRATNLDTNYRHGFGNSDRFNDCTLRSGRFQDPNRLP